MFGWGSYDIMECEKDVHYFINCVVIHLRSTLYIKSQLYCHIKGLTQPKFQLDNWVKLLGFLLGTKLLG